VTLLELGGSHAHSFRELVDELGLATLIIADLDATVATKVQVKGGGEATRWKSAKPKRGAEQKSANQVLKEWHPSKVLIDELIAPDPADHQSSGSDGYELYVAYQKPVSVSATDGIVQEVIPRTFEDALILEN
jgi:predicted ATP-dependent endonuclease of OLD family